MKNKSKKNTTNDTKKELSDVAYYQESVSAWFDTRIGRSSHILVLSSLGIGALVVADGPRDKIVPFCIWAIAGVLFLSSIFVTLRIFSISSDHIERLIHEIPPDDEKKIENSLIWRMKVVDYMFFSGAVVTFIWVAYKPVVKLFWGPMVNLLCGGK